MSRYRISDLSRLPDCCARSERGRCTRLTAYNCHGVEFAFKRTNEEDSESLQYAYELLSSLDISTQIYIAKKNYDSFMPWKEGKTVKTYI